MAKVKDAMNPSTEAQLLGTSPPDQPEVSDSVVTRAGKSKLSDLKLDSEDFINQLKHNFGFNIYEALKKVGWVEDIARTQIDGLDPSTFFEGIENKIKSGTVKEITDFKKALEDNITEQFKNIPYLDDVKVALDQDDPEAYLKDKVTTKIGELETNAKTKAIDYVIDSLNLPLNLRQTAQGVLFDKDIYSGDNLTVNYSGGKNFDGDYNQKLNYRYTNKDGKWGDVDLSSDKTSTYKYNKGPIDFSLSRRPKGDTRGELKYSQGFNVGQGGRFGIEASINDLLETSVALGYRYESPKTGAWFSASYNPNNPKKDKFEFKNPILTPNGFINETTLESPFSIEFGMPLGAGRKNKKTSTSFSPNIEQTVYRPSTAYQGPTINPETGLQEFNLKGKPSLDKVKEIEKRVGVKIKPFPDELIRLLPKNTQTTFFGAFVGKDGKLAFLDDIMNSKNPRFERINGQIYLPEDEVNVLTKIANSRKEEIKIVKEGTRNIPDARGFHSGLDDQSKIIDQEIIDAGRMGSAAAIEYAKKRGKKQYGQRMSVLPERGKGEIYRIRGLDTEAGEEPLPLSLKYSTKPKLGDQYTPFRNFSEMEDGSVNSQAVYNPQTDSIVYDDDEITKSDNEYPNTFRTHKDYVDHHELYHRGPGPGGVGGDKDHKTMDKYFDGLEKSNMATAVQKLGMAATSPPQKQEFEPMAATEPTMQEDIDRIEDKGRKGDTSLVHVTPGEMIITPEMVNDDPEFKAMLDKKYAQYGIDPGQATVGSQKAATNTSTGLEEFNLVSPSEGSMARSPNTRRNSMKVDMYSGTRARPMVYQPETIDTMGKAFSAGVSSGYDNIRAQNKNMRAALAALRGDDIAERNFLREGNRLEEQSGLELAGLDSTFASAIEEKNIHDFFLNTASATGQFIPSLAASLAEAIVVGGIVVGGTVLSRGTSTPGLVAAVGTASAARKATVATKTARMMQRTRPGMDKADVEDLLERAYRNQVQVQKGKTPNFPFNNQELADLDEIYASLRSLKRSRRFTQGAVLGAYSQEQRMGTGIAYSDYADQGMNNMQNAIKSIAQGQLFGAIGVGSEVAVAGITLKRLRQSKNARRSKQNTDPFRFEAIPANSMFKDFATITAVTGTSEALAESLQEELSIQQKIRIDDDYTKEQAQVDRVNAFFAGLMGGIGVGGGLGSGTAVMNKVRNYHARNIADREMFKILSKRENLAKLGRVMGERPKAIRGQFADMKDPNSPIDSQFTDIDSKKAWIKEQAAIEKMFGPDELISVATPTGAFFTTNPRKAARLANIMDSGYKFHTGILEDFLADALGYSRTRDAKDDVVVGLYNEKIQEFTKYQSAQEHVEGDVEAAELAMRNLRGALDPKQYTIKKQTLAQHRRFRQKGVDKGTTPASVRKELYQTDETMSEMNTDQDDRGVEGDRGRADPNVSAANIDIRRGKIDRQTREAFDAYIQEDYKLPINYSDLVFFVENSKKLVRAKDKKQIRKTLGKNRQRYLDIYKNLTSAESMGSGNVFTQEDREYLQRISTDFTSLVSSMEDLLEELAVTGQALQQEDSIGSSIARDEFGSREVMNLPLVGVSEVLTRTNVTGTKEDQKTARAPIKEADPTVMKRGGSGTAQNPFIDPTKIKGKGGIETKGFRISKEDPKAHGNSVNGINSLIHATLKEEFNAQKPFLTKGAIEMFKRRNAETQQNTQFEFLRFVDTRDLKDLRTATAANQTFTPPQRDPKKDAKRSYVIVRMKPEAEQFRELTRENVNVFRNIKEDLATRFEQAYQRTRGKNYKDDVYFYLQNLDPAAKSKVARPVDMSVLIEGVSKLSKILGRREQEEFTNPQAQRLSAFIDTIDLLNESNYSIEYEPYAGAKKESKPEDRFKISDMESRPLREGELAERKPEVGPPSPIIKVNKILDDVTTDPYGPGESILKIRIPKFERSLDPMKEQIRYLRKEFGLVKLAKDYYTRALFSEVNTPFVQLLNRFGRTNPTIDTSTVLPLLSNIKQTNMAEMSLKELEQLQDSIEDVLTVNYGIIDMSAITDFALSNNPDTKISKGLFNNLKEKAMENRSETARNAFMNLVRQDGTLIALLTEVSKVVSGINAQDIRNNPGELVPRSKALGQPGAKVIPGSKRVVKEGTTTTPTEVAFDYEGAGNIPVNYKQDQATGSLEKAPAGTINRDAPIGTYVDDIAQITMERSTAALDDSGLYMTDDPAMGAPVDNSAVKMDIRDRALFESYQEQQGKEYRGRDRYADMSRVTKKGTKPKLKDFNKYDKKTQLFLTKDKRVIQEVEDNFKQALKDRAEKMGAGSSLARAKLPFRKQIINNLIAGARQLGLETNLKIIAAETSFTDSQLSNDVKATIDQEQFEQKRQDLLDQTDKAAKTLSYQDFDVILMKTSDVMSEGQYYSAFLKELGNSLTFQELERSIKVPAIRKKLLQDFEKKLEGENVPENYKGDDGFENFLADQWSIEIRKTLGLEVDGTAYDSMSGPTKAWFKRLTNSQKKLYNKLNPAQRKRLQIDETFEEYAADLRDAVANPEAQKIHYKTKAKIESQIENILGPETVTDKELRKLMAQAQSILRSKTLPRWMQKVFLSSDTRFRNYTSHPTAGEELANFWNQDPRTVSKSGISGVYTRKNRRAATLHNTVAKKLGVKNGWLYSKLSNDQKKSVDLAADDTKDANVLTPEAQAVRKFLQGDVYKKLNLEKYGVGNRKNFFPRDVLVAEIAGNEALQEKTREVLQKYNPKATKKQIDKDVAYLIKSGDGGLEITADSEIEVGLLKERKKLWDNVPNKALMDAGLAAPAEVALQKYLDKVAMKYEFEQAGGKKALNRILNKLNEAEREDAKKIINSMNGKTPPIENGLLKTFNNIMLPLNVITLLAFTVLASLQDTAGPVLRSRGTAKISDVAKVIKDMMKNPTQAADFAREIGVIGVDAMSSFFIYAGEQNFMNQTAKNVSDVWFRITGLEAYTKFTRVFAVGMGTRFLQDHARKAKDGDKTSQLYLKELNVTADQVLAWEKGKANKATRELVNNALAQFVDESIVRPNPAQRPTYANDPRWATIWQLKSFFYAYGKTIVFPTLKEAHRGFVNDGMGAGAMPLLLMAGILVPITMLGLEIREASKAMLSWLLPGISPNDPGVNYFKSDKMSTGEYMTEILDRSGMLGPLSLALPIFSADHRYGKPFWVPPLGPTAERVYDARPWDFEMRTVDFVPVYSQLDTRGLGR